MNDRERIGEIISLLRKKHGLSQARLAELTGLNRAHIGRIELGRYNVGIDTLGKIANVFDCEVDIVKKHVL